MKSWDLYLGKGTTPLKVAIIALVSGLNSLGNAVRGSKISSTRSSFFSFFELLWRGMPPFPRSRTLRNPRVSLLFLRIQLMSKRASNSGKSYLWKKRRYDDYPLRIKGLMKRANNELWCRTRINGQSNKLEDRESPETLERMQRIF